ncbi:MAG: Lysophospholipase [Actinomycetia bacterium]|nr:Lysophospholipase [Actinomycetes bacterium]
MDEARIKTTGGTDLFYRRWGSTDATTTAVIVHGIAEHSGRYHRLAGALVDRGLAVYAPDHEGHGHTAASAGPIRAGASGTDGIVSDIDEVVDLARTETAQDRVLIIGHSMGALLAQAWAERHGAKCSGLVLTGSPGAGAGDSEMAAALAAAVDAGLGDDELDALGMFNAPFEPARTPYDWLSRDEAEVDAAIADPRSGDAMPLTYGFVGNVLRLAVEEMEPSEIARIPSDVPVLLLTGDADPVSSDAANVRVLESRFRDAGLNVDAHYYPGARHEVFNETNRDEVVADLLAWIEGPPRR